MSVTERLISNNMVMDLDELDNVAGVSQTHLDLWLKLLTKHIAKLIVDHAELQKKLEPDNGKISEELDVNVDEITVGMKAIQGKIQALSAKQRNLIRHMKTRSHPASPVTPEANEKLSAGQKSGNGFLVPPPPPPTTEESEKMDDDPLPGTSSRLRENFLARTTPNADEKEALTDISTTPLNGDGSQFSYSPQKYSVDRPIRNRHPKPIASRHPSTHMTKNTFLSQLGLVTPEESDRFRDELEKRKMARKRRSTANPKYASYTLNVAFNQLHPKRRSSEPITFESLNPYERNDVYRKMILMDSLRFQQLLLRCFICDTLGCNMQCDSCTTNYHSDCIRIPSSRAHTPKALAQCPKCIHEKNVAEKLAQEKSETDATVELKKTQKICPKKILTKPTKSKIPAKKKVPPKRKANSSTTLAKLRNARHKLLTSKNKEEMEEEDNSDSIAEGKENEVDLRGVDDLMSKQSEESDGSHSPLIFNSLTNDDLKTTEINSNISAESDLTENQLPPSVKMVASSSIPPADSVSDDDDALHICETSEALLPSHEDESKSSSSMYIVQSEMVEEQIDTGMEDLKTLKDERQSLEDCVAVEVSNGVSFGPKEEKTFNGKENKKRLKGVDSVFHVNEKSKLRSESDIFDYNYKPESPLVPKIVRKTKRNRERKFSIYLDEEPVERETKTPPKRKSKKRLDTKTKDSSKVQDIKPVEEEEEDEKEEVKEVEEDSQEGKYKSNIFNDMNIAEDTRQKIAELEEYIRMAKKEGLFPPDSKDDPPKPKKIVTKEVDFTEAWDVNEILPCKSRPSITTPAKRSQLKRSIRNGENRKGFKKPKSTYSTSPSDSTYSKRQCGKGKNSNAEQTSKFCRSLDAIFDAVCSVQYDMSESLPNDAPETNNVPSTTSKAIKSFKSCESRNGSSVEEINGPMPEEFGWKNPKTRSKTPRHVFPKPPQIDNTNGSTKVKRNSMKKVTCRTIIPGVTNESSRMYTKDDLSSHSLTTGKKKFQSSPTPSLSLSFGDDFSFSSVPTSKSFKPVIPAPNSTSKTTSAASAPKIGESSVQNSSLVTAKKSTPTFSNGNFSTSFEGGHSDFTNIASNVNLNMNVKKSEDYCIRNVSISCATCRELRLKAGEDSELRNGGCNGPKGSSNGLKNLPKTCITVTQTMLAMTAAAQFVMNGVAAVQPVSKKVTVDDSISRTSPVSWPSHSHSELSPAQAEVDLDLQTPSSSSSFSPKRKYSKRSSGNGKRCLSPRLPDAFTAQQKHELIERNREIMREMIEMKSTELDLDSCPGRSRSPSPSRFSDVSTPLSSLKSI